VSASLYVTPLSNPSKAAIAMVAYKQLPHRVVSLPNTLHPMLVRAAGFAGRTVPALALDDSRRVQGTLAISRVLDQLVPERPLFPYDHPAARRAVEDAERWGHDELQPVPRRIFRWASLQDAGLRRWVASEVAQLPAPGLFAASSRPLVARLVADSGASEEAIRADVARLPGLLDHVDALVASGTVGGSTPNAADFQILSSVRVLLDYKALPSFEHRPCAQAARRLFPTWEGEMPPFEIPGI
jgi:glutathione S-transferase